jgi:hypothetical protein
MAYGEKSVNTAFRQNSESASSTCRTSVFLIFIAVIIAFLLMIGLFHPGI